MERKRVVPGTNRVSVKVARSHGHLVYPYIDGAQAAGMHVYDLALALHPASHEQDLAEAGCFAILLEGSCPEDEVGDAGFVFECDEDHAAGGAGALADQDEARDADPFAVGCDGGVEKR
jgi:hypothetical protein